MDIDQYLNHYELKSNCNSDLVDQNCKLLKSTSDPTSPNLIKSYKLILVLKNKYEECLEMYNNILKPLLIELELDRQKLELCSQYFLKVLDVLQYIQSFVETNTSDIKSDTTNLMSDMKDDLKSDATKQENVDDIDDDFGIKLENTDFDEAQETDNFKPFNCRLPVKKEQYSIEIDKDGKKNKQKIKSCNNELKKIRERRKVHKCGYCSKAFITPLSLSKHLNNRHSKEEVPCKVESGHENFQSHYDEQLFNIDDSSNQINHITPSSQFDKSDSEIQDRNSSKKISSGNMISFPCDICDENFINKVKLSQHRWTSHGKGDFKCEACNECFVTNRVLDYHRVQQHQIFNFYRCHFCTDKFDSRFDLKKHRSSTHKEEVKQVLNLKYKKQKHFTCNLCGFSCGFKSRYDVHMLKHTDGKAFQCDQCEKSYTMVQALRRHLIIVHGNKEQVYKCEYCPKTFAIRNYLTKHTLTHTGEKNDVCDICGKAFADSSRKNRHTKTHFK